MPLSRRPLYSAILIVLGAMLSPLAFAQTAFKVDIAPQDLADALRDVGRQTNTNIIFESSIVKGIRVAQISAELTADQAIDRLLVGTGLVAHRTSNGTIVVQRDKKAAMTASSTTSAVQPDISGRPGAHDARSSARLAQTNNASEGTADGGAAQRDVRETESQELPAPEEQGKAIPEILVKGTRTMNMDIVRTRDGSQPYIVFDRENLERSGARNLEEFMRNQLTASASFDSNSRKVNFFGNTSSIDLRGLGPNQTLILVDGHRIAGHSFAGIPNQPDLNGIPLSAIERIEVLPTTASGIYGGGATGGVINVVLRRDYQGLETKVAYRGSFDGGGAERSIELSGGFNLSGGATSVLLAGSYSDANELRVENRDFATRGRDLILKNNPAEFLDSPVPPLGATTNIRSLTGENLTLKSGGNLVSAFASIPRGYAGASSDAGAALLANGGEYNFDLASTAQSGGGRRLSLLNSPTIKSATATVRHRLSDSVQAFLDLAASRNSGLVLGNPAIPIIVVADSAPTNPFNQTVFVSPPALGADGVIDSSLESERAVAGFIFSMPAAWRAEADYTWNRTRVAATGPAFNDAAAAAAINAGTIDVFRDGPTGADFSQFVLPSTTNRVTTTLGDFSVRFSGPLPRLWGADATTLSVLLERRKEQIGDFHQLQYSSATSVTDAFSPRRSQSVDSAAVELNVPLVSAGNRIPGVRLLELQLAGRRDDYETEGANSIAIVDGIPLGTPTRERNEFASTDPTLGLRIKPVDDLTFRASYGTGFLPPAVDQLTPELPFVVDAFTAGLLGLTDPLRGDEPIGEFEALGGGNPNLGPEESRSKSFGLVFVPHIVPGMRLSLDWTSIRKSDNIAAASIFDATEVRSLINFAPDRITRGAPSNGFAVGPITAIDGTLINFARASVEAWDLALDYRWRELRIGQLQFSSMTTRLTESRSQLAPDAPVVENVGVRGRVRWRANASLTWELHEWSAAWTTRYVGSYWLNPEHEIELNQGAASIPSQTYHDLFVRYSFAGGGSGSARNTALGELQLELGVDNLFNRSPPLDVTRLDRFYSTLGDPRLASYHLSVRKSF